MKNVFTSRTIKKGSSQRRIVWLLTLVPAIWLWQCSSQGKQQELIHLQSCLDDMQAKERALEEEIAQLQVRVHDQQDPQWIELILMQKLGLIPKGYTKVYFEKERRDTNKINNEK